MREGGVIDVSGNPDYAPHDVPEPNGGYIAVAAGLVHAIALRGNGSIEVWGFCGAGAHHVPQPNTDWIAVAAGGYSSMGLKSDGALYKWGCFPEEDQVIEPGTRFIAMACHYQHALAVREDGSVLAWGSNEFGQLNVPEPNSGFVAVACTADSSVGLKADGTIVVWGKTGPVAEPNGDFVSIAANNWDAYAIRSTRCQVSTECDDGNPCNGIEICVNGICQPGVPRCEPADFDLDGQVGPADLAQLLAHWGQCPAKGPCIGDIAPPGGDGAVGPADLAQLLAHWG
jgi:hypothetical protein